jgi:hypothetical protein
MLLEVILSKLKPYHNTKNNFPTTHIMILLFQSGYATEMMGELYLPLHTFIHIHSTDPASAPIASEYGRSQ